MQKPGMRDKAGSGLGRDLQSALNTGSDRALGALKARFNFPGGGRSVAMLVRISFERSLIPCIHELIIIELRE